MKDAEAQLKNLKARKTAGSASKEGEKIKNPLKHEEKQKEVAPDIDEKATKKNKPKRSLLPKKK
jgi:hypothetical protein